MNGTQKAADAAFVITVAGPADADQISDFIAGLSVRSAFRRFFASVARPSSGLLRTLAGADGRADVVVATDGAVVVSHGMAVDRTLPDGTLASDIGLVVADRWQSRGVGSAVLAALTQRAADRGVSELVMDVLPANDRMLAMIASRWPEARREPGRDSVMIRARLRSLDQATSRAPAPRAA
jgi:GNAT superfamily N-acetyltransferase